jgi:hypothetical protein
LGGFCSSPFPGAGGQQQSCSNNTDCATGFCADFGDGNPVCFALCTSDMDCANGGKCKPFNLPGTIEGAPTSGLKACTHGD